MHPRVPNILGTSAGRYSHCWRGREPGCRLLDSPRQRVAKRRAGGRWGVLLARARLSALRETHAAQMCACSAKCVTRAARESKGHGTVRQPGAPAPAKPRCCELVSRRPWVRAAQTRSRVSPHRRPAGTPRTPGVIVRGHSNSACPRDARSVNLPSCKVPRVTSGRSSPETISHATSVNRCEFHTSELQLPHGHRGSSLASWLSVRP